jgi:hypothetical protein
LSLFFKERKSASWWNASRKRRWQRIGGAVQHPPGIDRGLLRPTPSPWTFQLEQDELEIPTFDNAEGLVDRLVRRELIVRDEIVEGVVEGRPRAIHPRSVQRHFLEATG